MTEPAAYFVRLDERRFRATAHTGGAWSQEEQHIAPMVGLVVHEVERAVAARGAGSDGPGGPGGKAISRISMDILGVVAVDEFEVEVKVVRPGHTIELLEAVVTWAGRAVVRARVWLAITSDTSAVAGGEVDPMPGPAEVPGWDMRSVWPGGFIDSIDVRRSADARPGRCQAWVTTDLALVEGEEVSTLASFVGLVDTANGICVRESPREWAFPNLDLTVHLHREPMPGPTGLDTTVVFGSEGLGLTTSVLHDARGPVGRVNQTLTVRG